MCVVSGLAHQPVAPWTGEDTGGAENHVRAAAVYGTRLGQGFPALPEGFRSRFLITGGQDSESGLFSAANVASPRGFEPLLQP